MNARRIGHRAMGAIATVLCSMMTQACAEPEFDHLEVEQRSSSPAPVDATDDLVEVPMGIALRIKVKPVARGSNRYSANDELRFDTDDSSVMEAFQVEDTSQVVIAGVRVGSTCLRVLVNDRQVDCLDVKVVNQGAN